MKTSEKLKAQFSVEKAKAEQICLAKNVITEDRLPIDLNLVAGFDAAYTKDIAVGSVAVLDYQSLELLEIQTAKVKVPYIPTLLACRELPAALACVKKLKLKPDVFLVDGHGLAHPRKCGLACQFGLSVKKPTVGVAKSRLVGEPVKLGNEVFLANQGEIVAAVLQWQTGMKPVYVSVGHMVSLKTAVEVVKHCTRSGSRVPEPLRQAHISATEERIRISKSITLPSYRNFK